MSVSHLNRSAPGQMSQAQSLSQHISELTLRGQPRSPQLPPICGGFAQRKGPNGKNLQHFSKKKTNQRNKDRLVRFRLRKSEATGGVLFCRAYDVRVLVESSIRTHLESNGTMCLTKADVAGFDISPDISSCNRNKKVIQGELVQALNMLHILKDIDMHFPVTV